MDIKDILKSIVCKIFCFYLMLLLLFVSYLYLILKLTYAALK